MKVLIIGGTAFFGRALVEAAQAAGHEITLFNRGRSNPDLFPGVETIRGDRNDPDDLAKLRGGRWDAVIDTCGFVSATVRSSAEALADRVEHYTFISSISVYADSSQPGADESAPLAVMPDGQAEDPADYSQYGARKALCEQAAEAVMPGRVLSIRPGLIVGPYDYVDRFPYWVGRVDRGGEVLAPGKPEQPVQIIDVRDMAEWNLRLAEQRTVGIFNATGPEEPLAMGAILEACRQASGSDAQFTWVDQEFLLERGVAPFSDLPLWLPEAPEYAGFMRVDCRKAQQAGLRYRPLIETARDTLEWVRANPVRDLGRAAALGRPGLAPERERELLTEWRSAAPTQKLVDH